MKTGERKIFEGGEGRDVMVERREGEAGGGGGAKSAARGC